MKYYIAPILMAIFGIAGISYSVFRFIGYTSNPVVITPQTIAVYDSLKNVIAYKEKNKWIVIHEQGTLLVLEKEIYRLNDIANGMEKVNHDLKNKYDSLLKIKR